MQEEANAEAVRQEKKKGKTIHDVMQEQLRAKQKAAADAWVAEKRRIEEERQALEDRLANQTAFFDEIASLANEWGLDLEKIEKQRAVTILAILEEQGVDFFNISDRNNQELLDLAKQFGLDMVAVESLWLEQRANIQEEFGREQKVRLFIQLQEQFATTKEGFDQTLELLRKFGIDSTSLNRQRLDAAADFLEAQGLEILALTERQESQVQAFLEKAGLDQRDLKKLQNERLLELQTEFGREVLIQTDHQLKAELQLQKQQTQQMQNLITASSGDLLNLLVAAQSDRITLAKDQSIVEAEEERQRKLIQLKRQLVGRGAFFNDEVKRINAEFNTESLAAEDAAAQARLDAVRAANEEVLAVEQDRANRLADILGEQLRAQQEGNTILTASLLSLEDAYGGVETSVLSLDRATRQLIATQKEQLASINAAEDALVGNSLGPAYDSVADSMRNADMAQRAFNMNAERTASVVAQTERALVKAFVPTEGFDPSGRTFLLRGTPRGKVTQLSDEALARQRLEDEKGRFAEQFETQQAHFDRLRDLASELGLDVTKIEEARAESIFKVLNLSNLDILDLQSGTNNQLLNLAQEFGLTISGLEAVQAEERLAIQKQFGFDMVQSLGTMGNAYDSLGNSINNVIQLQDRFTQQNFGTPFNAGLPTPNRIQPPSVGIPAPGNNNTIILQVENFYGGEAERAALADDITRLQSDRGVFG